MAGISEDGFCTRCGTELGFARPTEGLCPGCLLRLGVDSDSRGLVLEAPTKEGVPGFAVGGPARGRIIGKRYQIRGLLGRGGMGEVWRAFDLKLRVDVALKALRPDRMDSRRAQEQLRQEVRSAREVVSLNVCRIFDLIVESGEELVSMELIDGTTLAEVLDDRGPLDLQEAREIASQFLSGLEAIHQAGLVHRDFKPENIMITRAGRVVVMDFGIEKARTAERTNTVFGTPPYMAPEQASGGAVDGRADVFSAGVVLAEMLSIGGQGSGAARRALWDAVRDTPPRVPEGPWAPVLRKTLAQRPESRYLSARAVAHALEEVAFRFPSLEEKRPFPGLASFTESDAEFFFGRELEVEAVWKKLKGPRLLAVVGPSGAGKTSFIRAGVLSTLPRGWGCIYCTPGNRPFRALAQALVPAFSGDTEAFQSLLRFDDVETALSLVSRWRQQHQKALIVLDQFEELFTLNPRDVQDVFAKLLLRLVLEADVGVLLSMRDDFLVHCHGHDALASIFAGLAPLGMPGESSLRRALVQPALACGYRFEDDTLPEQMIKEVSGGRGALPLLAFAASRLWERRDRERGLLMRQAYEEIGGVGGALARHAEEALEEIGRQRTPVVREIFRNLVTAQGTRASRDIDELLSIFGNADERQAAEQVLQGLVAARLLTTYETAGDGERQVRRVEIIHESLLSAWPRLVRWQTQDADAAQFRDQIREAARVWQARGRPDDLLWSGSAYRDFAVWREHYPGGLSATEDAFAQAATRRASRSLRQRRLAVAMILATAVSIAVLTSALWQRSVTARQRAEAEALRAEASKLLALGEIELDTFPTAAVAYALKSLEMADTGVGRLFALRALQAGPAARLTPLRPPGDVGVRSFVPAFSPNGEWLALGGFQKVQILNRDGRSPLVLGDYPQRTAMWIGVGFGPRSDLLVANRVGDVRVWSIPEGRELKRGAFELGPPGGPSHLVMRDSGFVTGTMVGIRMALRWWPFTPGEPHAIGSLQSRAAATEGYQGPLVYSSGRQIYERSLEDWSLAPHLLAEMADVVVSVSLSRAGRWFAAADRSGNIRVWETHRASPMRILAGKGVISVLLDSSGRRLAGIVRDERGRASARVWDLTAPPGAEPVIVRRTGQYSEPSLLAFDPSGQWLLTTHGGDAALWPVDDDSPRVLAGHQGAVQAVAFTPDGTRLISASTDRTVRSWPLTIAGDGESRILLRHNLVHIQDLAVDSESRLAALADGQGHLLVISLKDGAVRELDGLPSAVGSTVAFGERGRLVAAAPYGGAPEERRIRVWNLETGTFRILTFVAGAFEGTSWGFDTLQFLDSDRLIASVGRKGLMMYDLKQDSGRALPGPSGQFALSRDRQVGVGISVSPEAAPGAPTSLMRFDPGADRPPTTIGSYGGQSDTVALDSTGTLVSTGSLDGTVRIGAVAGGEPYVFFGHQGWTRTIAFSPHGRWVASGGDDGTIRLWPVPDFSKPPLHARRHEEVLAVLRSRTNLRLVSDPRSATAWTLARDPFPGWAKLPEH